MIGFLFNKVLRIREKTSGSASPPTFVLPLGITKVFFGDSVFLRVSKNDKDIETLKEMLSGYYGNSRVSIFAHSALALPHYLMYLLCAKHQLAEVREIVIPINYRAFSLQWELNPEWQYTNVLQNMIELCGTNDFSIQDIVSNRNYKLASATYFMYGKQPSDFFLKSIAKKPLGIENFIERRRKIFAFNYLFDERVIANSKRFYAFSLLINKLDDLREKLVFFIPPINYQAIEFLLGDQAVDYLKKNIAFVVNYGHELGVKVHDFSMIADRFCFFNELEATEHLNEVGRKILLNKIGEVVVNE